MIEASGCKNATIGYKKSPLKEVDCELRIFASSPVFLFLNELKF